MARTEDIKGTLQKTAKPQELKSLIEASAKELGRALPEHMRPERLVRIALTAIRMNPELANCTPESFLGALFTSAQLGLEPVSNQAYLLPFNNKRKIGNEWKTFKECQFIVGYGGLVTLFYRHEKALYVSWGIVHEKDKFDYQKGTSPYLNHKEAEGNRGSVKGYYAVAHLQGGAKLFEYMTHDECIEHGKKHSKTYDKKESKFYDNSPWSKDVDAMCLKTVLKKLSKLMPLSYEMQRAIAADETSREFRSGIDDVLDIPSTMAWDETTTETPLIDFDAIKMQIAEAQNKEEVEQIFNEALPHLEGERLTEIRRASDKRKTELKGAETMSDLKEYIDIERMKIPMRYNDTSQ